MLLIALNLTRNETKIGKMLMETLFFAESNNTRLPRNDPPVKIKYFLLIMFLMADSTVHFGYATSEY